MTQRPDPPAEPQTLAAPAPEPAWPRIKSALARPSHSQAVVAVLLALLGFATVTQVRLTRTTDGYAGLRQADLVQVLTGLNAQSAGVQRQIARLRATQRQLLSATGRRQAALRSARGNAGTLGILAGTTPAYGPGLRITVSSQSDVSSLNDLLDCIEELRDAGAEAIEINDSVRVIAQTWFDLGGNGLIVDGHQLRSPYSIDVIGDPATLREGIDFGLGGFTQKVRAAGGTVGVQTLHRVVVGSTVRLPASTQASPASGGY